MAGLLDVIPGGRWTLLAAGLLTVPAVRRQVRPLAVSAIRAGLAVSGGAKGLVSEVRDGAGDLVSEVREEGTAATTEPGATAKPSARASGSRAKAAQRRIVDENAEEERLEAVGLVPADV